MIVKAEFTKTDPDDPQELVISNQYGEILYQGTPTDAMLIAMEGFDKRYFLTKDTASRAQSISNAARVVFDCVAPEQPW